MKILPNLILLRRLFTWMIWILVAVGLVFRLTVRDSFRVWCLIYYVTPLPALPIWFLIAGWIGPPEWTYRKIDPPQGKPSRLSPRRLNLLLSAICLVWAAWSECQFRAVPSSPDDVRLVFWNVARIWASVPRLASQIKSWDASIVALVEADQNYRVNELEWKNALPEYSVVSTHYGGLIAVKGTVISNQFHSLSVHSWCEQFDLRVNDMEFTLLLVDISSQLTRLRDKPLAALARLAAELQDRPLVIVGDFNTPDDSLWLVPLREQCREAFRERGNGYAPTWPVPCPVLKLDQVWFNKQVNVSQCRNGWSVYSDHRPVITEISFPRQ